MASRVYPSYVLIYENLLPSFTRLCQVTLYINMSFYRMCFMTLLSDNCGTELKPWMQGLLGMGGRSKCLK